MLILTSEAKQQLRLDEDNTEDDTRITGIVAAVIQEISDWTGRVIEKTSSQFVLDGFVDHIRLPIVPLISVTKINYIDSDGIVQTMPTNQYRVDTRKLFPVITPVYGESWPVTTDAPESVSVFYDAGYETLPEKLKTAGLLLIEDLYYDTGRIAAESLMNSYKLPLFG